MRRGEVWWHEPPGEKVRPVVILTRNEAIGRLNKLVVAPSTGKIWGIPSEVEDFDAEVEAMDPRDIQINPGDPDAIVTVLPGMTDEDARRLVELAVERGKSVREVLAELVRDAA